MRFSACFLLVCITAPSLAQQKVAHDFRGGKFDPDLLRYHGPTPEKFMTPEPEGLRLRYPGKDVPPQGDPSAVSWRLEARGDFVVTARYEILRSEPPAKGNFAVGAELYLLLGNASKDGVALRRGVHPDGKTHFKFIVLANDANGKFSPRDSKTWETGDRSRKGRLRLARTGSVVTASFAEDDDAEFIAFQQAEIGMADVRLIRFTGVAGGARNAVLDMRMLEFELQADELARDGRFKTQVPKTPKEEAIALDPAEQAVPLPPAPAGKLNLLIFVGALFTLGVAAVIMVGVWFLLRRKSGTANDSPTPRRRSRERIQ